MQADVHPCSLDILAIQFNEDRPMQVNASLRPSKTLKTYYYSYSLEFMGVVWMWELGVIREGYLIIVRG